MIAPGDVIGMPKVQPIEFVLHLADRGITVATDDAGNLVTLPDDLPEADRRVLRENRPAIVAALPALMMNERTI